MDELAIARLGKPVVALLARLTGLTEAHDVATAFADVAKGAGAGGWVERNHIRRQLDTAAETVGDRMLGFIRQEFRGIDDGDIQATVLAVGEALDRYGKPSSTNDLVSLVADPVAFTKSVTEAGASLRKGLVVPDCSTSTTYCSRSRSRICARSR